MAFELTSAAIRAGQPIPSRHTGDGEDLSPPLAWSAPPDATRSFALICEDPDAPRGIWVHWVLYTLPATCRSLDEGVEATAKLSDGSVHGKNDFGNLGYGGPAPPRGKPHRYFFKLYALDTELSLKSGASRHDVLEAMRGHVLAEAELMGTYQRT